MMNANLTIYNVDQKASNVFLNTASFIIKYPSNSVDL